jgi:hypothetical protein
MTDTPRPSITPVRCTIPGCPWAVHGIPDQYVGSRNDFLRRHLADDHKPRLDTEPVDVPSAPLTDEQHADTDSYHRHLRSHILAELSENIAVGRASMVTDRIMDLVRPELDRLRAGLDRARSSSAFWESRYREESRTCWDDGLPPGGECCAVCGQPVESEPCPEHHPATVADRLRTERTEAAQLSHQYRNERDRLRARLDAIALMRDRVRAGLDDLNTELEES